MDDKTRKVKILGEEYLIFIKTKEEDKNLENADGYCDKTSKKIVVLRITDKNCDFDYPQWYEKKVMRHEIVHAFLFESGLHENAIWGDNESAHPEQMVDWIAAQGQKIYKAWEEAGCLG